MFLDAESLTVELQGTNAVLTLNRPEKRNVLSAAMMSSILSELAKIGASKDIRTVTIASSGTVFSAGHDLSELAGRNADEYQRVFDLCSEMMLALQSIPQPVIAEVQGLASAAGCQLVAACDLAVASTSARFATPGVKIGLFCTTPMVPLVRTIGRKRAMEMLLTGTFVSSETALLWGLVNRVVPPERLRETTNAFAGLIAAASHDTLAIGKRAFYHQVCMDEAGAYSAAKQVMADNAATENAQEGISAFLSKRNPVWRP
ncbi:MAG TPA: enoyl-CoA hydratase [Bryobacteraceae bacterium]|nr:enoyl-CoA hydratase [Bryobacteraceae bacterium]